MLSVISSFACARGGWSVSDFAAILALRCWRCQWRRVEAAGRAGGGRMAALAALARPPLISEPFNFQLPTVLAGACLSGHRRIAGGVEGPGGASFFLEQRQLQAALGFGDLIKRRKTERQDALLVSCVTDFGLSPGHVSLPEHVHKDDSAAVILLSMPLTLAWLYRKHENYGKAHGSNGSEAKRRKVWNLLEELFEEARKALQDTPGVVIMISGVTIPIDESGRFDLAPVVAAFPAMPAEWTFFQEQGLVAAPWPGGAGASLLHLFEFLCARVTKLPRGTAPTSPLTQFRNAVASIAGSMLERVVVRCFSDMQAHGGRAAHQVEVTPLFGKTGQRRARKSTADVLRNLQLAERVGHAESVLRASSGSHWIHGAKTRIRCIQYASHTKTELGPAPSLSLCWDGLSVSGLNVQTALGYNDHTGMGAYLVPKASFCSRRNLNMNHISTDLPTHLHTYLPIYILTYLPTYIYIY